MPNRLQHEHSPYLLQHQTNPVDWYPWGDAAFEKARTEDKPIFLSIGYATCHWCHVMEHESFEDVEVAALMNDVFVSIKVDREERPDIDQVYMTYCQLSTGHGGWPLTIIMTPDKQPFFAATYLPKQSRFGRIGMLDLIPRVEGIWQTQRSEVLKSAAQNTQVLQEATHWETTVDGPAPGVLEFAYQQLFERYDATYGGFGTAPKFPSPHQLQFLIRYGKRSGNNQPIEMAGHTLKQMRLGGIFDHVGYGFHRYSTDREWLLPHFEKMLYDQATIALAAIDAFQATGDEAFIEIVEKIFAYVLRDMTDDAGGFYSAEDADSEGVEGKFYVWSVDEIERELTPREGSVFLQAYNCTVKGNFKEEATGELTGENIPHLTSPLEQLALDGEKAVPGLSKIIEGAREKLFHAREVRVHPEKDDKILTDWNGLMIAAFSRAAQVLDAAEYAKAAQKAVLFIRSKLGTETGRLLHRYRRGAAGLSANLDDYAFLIWGLLELYEATFELSHLRWALSLNRTALDLFWDDAAGGCFFTPKDGEPLIARQKEAYDGAIPSGNSVFLLNLLRLGRMTGEVELEEKASQLMQVFGRPIDNQPSGFTAMLGGIAFARGDAFEIVIVGEQGRKDTLQMIRTIHETYLPNKVVLLKSSADQAELSSIAPFTDAMQALNGKATVYVCRNFQCNQSVTEAAALKAALSNGA